MLSSWWEEGKAHSDGEVTGHSISEGKDGKTGSALCLKESTDSSI